MSAQRRRPSSQRHAEVWSWSVGSSAWQTTLAGKAWEGHFQAGPHDVGLQLFAWTNTSVPRRAHHPSHRSRISTRPASRCGTETWPDLRLKWPQADDGELINSHHGKRFLFVILWVFALYFDNYHWITNGLRHKELQLQCCRHEPLCLSQFASNWN